jgi:hypothetical protein
MLDELRRILKAHYGTTSWTQQSAIEELVRKDSL